MYVSIPCFYVQIVHLGWNMATELCVNLFWQSYFIKLFYVGLQSKIIWNFLLLKILPSLHPLYNSVWLKVTSEAHAILKLHFRLSNNQKAKGFKSIGILWTPFLPFFQFLFFLNLCRNICHIPYILWNGYWYLCILWEFGFMILVKSPTFGKLFCIGILVKV